MTPTVLILGAGMAGKCAAKLLAENGFRVVLVDRRFAPAPQSPHLHVLLEEGQRLLAEIFPSAWAQVRENCPEVNWGSETYWRTPAGPMSPRELTTRTHLLSRGYLDELLLAELREETRIELVQGSDDEYQLSPERKRVISVRLQDRTLDCDVCVDAMGRYSRISRFLEKTFSKKVRTEQERTSLRYFSMFARRKTAGPFRQAYFQIDSRREHLGGVISPIENGRMIATVISIDPRFELTEHPFRLIDDEVFQEFVSQVEFEKEPTAFGNLHNVLHHYERYDPLPSNLFFIGDSHCQFNPVFGQGMTVALQSARLMAKFLLENPHERSLGFQKQLSKMIRFPWAISTMDPYNSAVRQSLTQRVGRALLHRVIQKAKDNPRIHQELVDVLHMTESPRSLFRLRNLVCARRPACH